MRLTILFFLLFSLINAQKSDLTSAILAFQKKDTLSAKELIDNAYNKFIEKGMDSFKPKLVSKFWHYRGQIYLALGDLDISVESFINDIEKDAKGGLQKKSVNALNLCAIKCLNQADENYKKALNLFETDKVLAKENLFNSANLFLKTYNIRNNQSIGVIDTASLFNSCLLFSDVGTPDADGLALEQARKLVELNPKDEKFQIRLLVCLEKNGDNDLLLSALNSARTNIPGSQDIINREVNFYISVDDKEGLKNSLYSALESDSDNPILHFALGTALQSLEDFEGAKKSYKQAIQLDPNYFDAHNNLVSMYLDETTSLITKMNNLGSRSSDQKKYNNYKKRRDNIYNECIPHLEKCVEIKPDNITILTALKELYYKTGDINNMKRIKSLIESL